MKPLIIGSFVISVFFNVNLVAQVYNESEGLVILEAENTPSDYGNWIINTSTDPDEITGTSSLEFRGNNPEWGLPDSPLEYSFRINTPGIYIFDLHCAKEAVWIDGVLRQDVANDAFIRVDGDYNARNPHPDDVPWNNGGYNNAYHNQDAPLSALRSDQKYFGGLNDELHWEYGSRLDLGGHNNKRFVAYDFKAGETYKLVIHGRSKFFKINRIMFRHESINQNDARDLSNPESSLISEVSVTGDLMRWHKVTLELDGPSSSQSATPNPFIDYLFDVTFTGPSGQQYKVPGYFAGDGNGGASGNKWHAHLNPDEVGEWTWQIDFRQGNEVAVSTAVSPGTALAPYDGMSGGPFTVVESDKVAPDFRAPDLGRLVKSSNDHYLTYAGSGKPFLYTGPGIPENILGYRGFTNTTIGIGHEFTAHESDWNSGDPDWDNGAGRRLIGALNYVANEGGNAIYMMSNTLGGDGKDVFMHPSSSMTDQDNKERYDLLKMQQWDIALSHAQSVGLFLHWVLAENETLNKEFYGAAADTPQRRLYFRMVNAFFGHYNALKWNLMEENSWDNDQIRVQAQYMNEVDPYDRPITYQVGGAGVVFEDYLGHLGETYMDAGSFQGGANTNEIFDTIQQYRTGSADAGQPWTIAWDEPQKIENDNSDFENGYPHGRRNKMWPALFAGADGFMWYIQADGGGHGFDQRIADFSIMQKALNWSQYIREFLGDLPLLDMTSISSATSSAITASLGDAYMLQDPGEVYAIFNHSYGSGMSLDLTNQSGSDSYTVHWFDPRTGIYQVSNALTSISGGGLRDLGTAPYETDKDWAILVRNADLNGPPEIKTQSLPDTLVNLDYFQPLSIFDGKAPFTWSLSGGLLPAGLSLDTDTGIISGSPTALGATSFTIQVEDQNGATDTQTLTLAVVSDPDARSEVFSPSDDAYINGTSPVNNSVLGVDYNNWVSYLKFDVSGITTDVQNATLSLQVGSNGGSGTLNVYQGSPNTWTENTLTDANKPTKGTLIHSINGSFVSGSTVNVDLTSLLDENGDGIYTVIVEMASGGNDVAFSSKEGPSAPQLMVDYRVLPPPPGQTPHYGDPWPVPSPEPGFPIEAEDYDGGGQGVAYFDSTVENLGAFYRNSESVDVSLGNGASSGFYVTETEDGEWLEYTLNVTEAGFYDVSFRLASIIDGGAFSLSIDGTPISQSINVPNTGSLATWRIIQIQNIPLQVGEQVLRVTFDAGGFNFDRMAFTLVSAFGAPPTATFAQPDPAEVEEGYSGSIYVKVNASSDGGSIANVRLYLDDVLVRQENGAPYEWGHQPDNPGHDSALRGLSGGTYTLKAVATDNDGATSEASLNLTVTSPVNEDPDPAVIEEFVTNGDFSGGKSGWGNWLHAASSADATFNYDNGAAEVEIRNGGVGAWSVQFFQTGFALQAGEDYTLSFDARCATGSMSIGVILSENGNFSNPDYVAESFTIDTIQQKYGFTFTSPVTDPAARLDFYLGNQGANFVIIDNVRLTSMGPGTPIANYSQWQGVAFEDSAIDLQYQSLLEDPDLDGMKNLLEYAFGTDPTVQTAEKGMMRVLFDEIEGAAHYTFIYPRLVFSTDIAYTIGYSYDLVNWNYTGDKIEEVSVTPVSEEIEWVKVRYTGPTTTDKVVFFRIEVE